MTVQERSTLADRAETAQLFLDALQEGTEAQVAAVDRSITDDVVLRGIFGQATGRDGLIAFLTSRSESGGFGGSQKDFLAECVWSPAIPAAELDFPTTTYAQKPPGSEGDDAIVIASHKPPRHFAVAFSFDGRGRISRMEVGGWMDVSEKKPVRIPETIAKVMSTAPDRWRQVVVAYPTPDGKMHVGVRGSAYVYSDDQIAFWARGDGGSFARAIAHNPDLEIGLLLFDPGEGAYYEFYGRGRIEKDEAKRKDIYDSMHEWERTHEWDGAGQAVIVDIDRVRGTTGEEFVEMERGR